MQLRLKPSPLYCIAQAFNFYLKTSIKKTNYNHALLLQFYKLKSELKQTTLDDTAKL